MRNFEDDLPEIKRDVTQHVIFHINKTPELYKQVVEARDVKDPDVAIDRVAQVCYEWAEAHNEEFGDLFQTELDFTEWHQVIDMV